jgi:glutamate 5-kinase
MRRARFRAAADQTPGAQTLDRFFQHPNGALSWIDGRQEALREAGKSLCRPAVARCDGDSRAGDVVRICDLRKGRNLRAALRSLARRKCARGSWCAWKWCSG